MRKFPSKRYILAALVLAGAGVGASVLLIPGEDEVLVPTTVASQPAAIDLSTVDVEAEYAQGKRSYAIVAALADKRVAAGDRPAAILLLEEFVKTNPNDVSGHKKLAEQYQLAGRQTDYNTQLEFIANAEPTEANLRVLSDIYNANKDYPKQVEVLKKMVGVTQGNNPAIFVDLATIQVVIGDKESALATVEQLRAKHPNFSNYPITRILVSVLSDKGEVDRAYQIAQEWIATPAAPVAATTQTPGAAPLAPAADTDPRPKELADLCNILHYSGHPDKAVALVEPHLEMLQREPELVVAYVKANITLGRADHAYAILQKIDEAGKMTPALYAPYLELAIKREDIAAAETIANKLAVLSFNEVDALNLIEVARANNAPTVMRTLTARFGDAKMLEGKPVLAAVIAILENQKTQDSKVEVALNTPLSSVQRLRLAETCARARKAPCFDAILKQFPTLDTMSPAQIAEYAQLFIIAERAPELVQPVGVKAFLPSAHADVVLAHKRLAAAAGRLDVLKPWLEQYANVTPIIQLQELFYLANDRKKTDVAMDVAERLYARDPSPMNRDIMTNAFISAGRYDKAIVLLRAQVGEAGANDGLYLSTLSKLARTDVAARRELTDYALAALEAKRGDARQQLNYAYILINNGRRDAALPYAKTYAGERGGEWKKMLAQLTNKGGKNVAAVKLTREQRVAMAASKSISEANKRQIAFSLLNDGHKADAAVIFQQLAESKGPDSQEVKDLLFIWGGKLNPTQLSWIQQRAATASGADKARWSDVMLNAADDQALLTYVGTAPDALYNRNLRKKYFRILADTGSRQNYDSAMRGWVSQTTDVTALIDYASTAQAFGFSEAAINGYGRVLALDPNNAQALSQSAALNYSKGKYKEADQSLARYVGTQNPQAPDLESNPAQAHFYRAQLLRRQGNAAGAAQEFQQVVALTPQAAAPDALSRLYTSMFHLGQHPQAKAGFNQLLANNPDNKGLLADYMSVLIEYKYTDEATRLANHYDKNSPYYGKGAALKVTSATIASVERLSNGRELKINFSQPLDENVSPITSSDAGKLAWLERSEVNYDSMTVSAKPGYVVRIVPTAQEQFALVPARAPEYSPQVEQQRQQDLRLQLLYAQIEQQNGQTERAKQRLTALAQYYPEDAQLIANQANIEAASGNSDQASALMARAIRIAPEHEDYSSLNRVASPTTVASQQYVKLDHEYRNFGSNQEQITTLSGVARINRNTEAGVILRNNFINPEAMVDPETGAISTSNRSRQAGEIYVGHFLGNGDRLQASLFSNTKDVGVGGYYGFKNLLGRTELLAEYNKTYWDFPEAVNSYTTRDRVGFTHYADVGKKTSLGLESSINNYNVESENNVVQTFLFRASVTHALQQQTATQPFLGVGYGFDGEYLLDKPDSITGVNGLFRPLDFRTREVHQVTGIYRDDWRPTTHVLFAAGWVADRIGGADGPVVEGVLTENVTDRLEMGLRGRYSRVNSNADGDIINAGAYAKVNF